jgi:hypothetical protein
MISGKLFRQILDKFLVSPVVQNARVQVCLPDGSFYDIKEVKLLENKLIGVRESHRLVITIEPETYRMGKVLRILRSHALKILLLLVLPIYWGIIITATFSLLN